MLIKKIGWRSKNRIFSQKKKKKRFPRTSIRFSFPLRYWLFTTTCHKARRSEPFARTSLSFQSVFPLFLPSTAISRQVFLFSLNFLPLLNPSVLSSSLSRILARFSFLFALFLALSFHRLRTCRSPAVAFDSIQFFR